MTDAISSCPQECYNFLSSLEYIGIIEGSPYSINAITSCPSKKLSLNQLIWFIHLPFGHCRSLRRDASLLSYDLDSTRFFFVWWEILKIIMSTLIFGEVTKPLHDYEKGNQKTLWQHQQYISLPVCFAQLKLEKLTDIYGNRCELI